MQEDDSGPLKPGKFSIPAKITKIDHDDEERSVWLELEDGRSFKRNIKNMVEDRDYEYDEEEEATIVNMVVNKESERPRYDLRSILKDHGCRRTFHTGKHVRFARIQVETQENKQRHDRRERDESVDSQHGKGQHKVVVPDLAEGYPGDGGSDPGAGDGHRHLRQGDRLRGEEV